MTVLESASPRPPGAARRGYHPALALTIIAASQLMVVPVATIVNIARQPIPLHLFADRRSSPGRNVSGRFEAVPGGASPRGQEAWPSAAGWTVERR